jgi:hypothetical protein
LLPSTIVRFLRVLGKKKWSWFLYQSPIWSLCSHLRNFSPSLLVCESVIALIGFDKNRRFQNFLKCRSFFSLLCVLISDFLKSLSWPNFPRVSSFILGQYKKRKEQVRNKTSSVQPLGTVQFVERFSSLHQNYSMFLYFKYLQKLQHLIWF